MLFGLHDRPGPTKALLAAVAHLLAIVASIATAPLLIARAIGLDTVTTTYVIASALMVSGLATAVQVKRLGPFGSGLLSVQGTSFAFIGVFAYAAGVLAENGVAAEAIVGTLLGSAAAGALVTVIAGAFIQHLGRVITQNVTGVAIFLLGISLVLTAYNNLQFTLASASAALPVWLQVLTVLVVITVCATRTQAWLRLTAIPVGLVAGLVVAWLSGSFTTAVTFPGGINLLQILPFGLGFDFTVFLLLLPIYLVTMTESVGDLTATNMLSGEPMDGPPYWQRVRGGVMADGLNSMFAASLGTFPNTTFSQNNGVIQLTGVASRLVGYLVAGGLLILGALPAFSYLFTLIPGGVLHATTGLLFAMIALAGIRILRLQEDQSRACRMLIGCSIGALVLAQTPALLSAADIPLPQYAAMLLSFPVATGAAIAIIWELCSGHK